MKTTLLLAALAAFMCSPAPAQINLGGVYNFNSWSIVPTPGITTTVLAPNLLRVQGTGTASVTIRSTPLSFSEHEGRPDSYYGCQVGWRFATLSGVLWEAEANFEYPSFPGTGIWFGANVPHFGYNPSVGHCYLSGNELNLQPGDDPGGNSIPEIVITLKIGFPAGSSNDIYVYMPRVIQQPDVALAGHVNPGEIRYRTVSLCTTGLAADMVLGSSELNPPAYLSGFYGCSHLYANNPTILGTPLFVLPNPTTAQQNAFATGILQGVTSSTPCISYPAR